MNAKKYEYNGEKLTEYEATQKQRLIERNIRRWKREFVGMDSAGLDTGESAAKIAQWQRTQRDFLQQTGLKRQADREAAGGYSKVQAKKANLSKATDVFSLVHTASGVNISAESILQNMEGSEVGKRALFQLDEMKIKPILDYSIQTFTHRGEQQGNIIKIYMSNIKSDRIAAQTIIHEATHAYYGIGQSQWAEAVCFAQEKMHLTGKTTLTIAEKRNIVKIAKDNYPEFNWRRGGYGPKR